MNADNRKQGARLAIMRWQWHLDEQRRQLEMQMARVKNAEAELENARQYFRSLDVNEDVS